jgi:hypothetical protein
MRYCDKATLRFYGVTVNILQLLNAPRSQKSTSPEAGYGFAALRAWNEQRTLVPQTHSLDGAEFKVAENKTSREERPLVNS